MSSADFISSHIDPIIDDITVAIGFKSDWRDEFSETLASLAEISEQITLIRSGGNCGGYWHNRHYVIETDHRRYSISIGGE